MRVGVPVEASDLLGGGEGVGELSHVAHEVDHILYVVVLEEVVR